MKGKQIISLVTLLVVAACAKETFYESEWLGRGVNFSATMASLALPLMALIFVKGKN